MATDRLLADRLAVIRLFDVYARLLTQRQQRLIVMYFHDDLSLSEIAERFGVTRQAIHDGIRRSLGELARYEDLLGVVHRGRAEDWRRAAILREVQALEDEIARLRDAEAAGRLRARALAIREMV
jgi:predicted DNA-binding protein YlxM (UPF0122 family)